MARVRGIVLWGLVLGAATGCSTTATVTRSDGTSIEGWIEGGTADSVIVDSRVGKRSEVRRNEITEIDHPGNVHAVVGGSVLAYGGIVIASSFPNCRADGETTVNCGAALIPALIGAGILTWGLVTWAGSKEAADDRSHHHLPLETPRPREPPPTAPFASGAAPPAAPPPPAPSSPARSDSAPPAPSDSAPSAPSPPAPVPPAEEPPNVTW